MAVARPQEEHGEATMLAPGAVSQMLQQLVAVALVKLVGINQEDRIIIRKGLSVVTFGLCPLTVLAKPLQSPCCQKRKACSCFSITTMK